jgi:two-component system response regulator CpxR
VEIKAGPSYRQSDVNRQNALSLPSKVLLVDDERDFADTLSERLHLRDVGASVVYDGEQALKFLAEERPELVVLDLRMPGLDGIEVLASIKKDFPEVEVIVLTGHGSRKDREKCLALGAFAFLQKPVDFEELAEVMRQSAGRKKS